MNLSKKKLNNCEEKVLSLGLNFSVTTKRMPKTAIIANIEKGIKNLPKGKADAIRSKVVNILNHQRINVNPNLSREEEETFKKFSKQ